MEANNKTRVLNGKNAATHNFINTEKTSDFESIRIIAKKHEEAGNYNEAISLLKKCLKINNSHIPVLNSLAGLYKKTGDNDLANFFRLKTDEALRQLWDKKIELEMRKRII